MRPLESSYEESPTKTKTRYAIVEAAAELFIDSGMESVTMIDVAKACDITTRNLYRYYPSKEYLIVDTAYHFMTSTSSQEEIIVDDTLTGIEQVEVILKEMFEIERSNQAGLRLIKLIMYFDLYLTKMETDHPAFIKYTTEYVKHINDVGKHDLALALRKGIKDRSINIKEEEVDFYNEYIVQSLFSIVMRTIVKEHENKAINATLVDKHIEVLLDHLK